MATILYNMSQVLGITIIHSLWQGLLIYFVLKLLFAAMPKLSSVKKYNLSSLGLVSMAAWFAYTFYAEAQAYNWGPVTATYASPLIAGLHFHTAGNVDLKTMLYATIKSYLPYISVLYAVGLMVNLGKLGLAWNKIRLIKKGMIAADTLQQRINTFSQQLNIRKRVQVSFSRLVDVPCVIGYFKPILLLPITLTFQLSAEEIETILLHELSHIKSNDYLVNLVQQLISVVLFFNPFAQLINRIISEERENRCDDVVVETSGNPLTYAYALLKLEEARQTDIKLALAATQNKNYLLTRIERIMKTKQPIGNIRHILLAVVLFAGSLSSIAWLNPEIKSTKAAIKNTVHTLFASVTNTKPVEPAVKAPIIAKHKKPLMIKPVDTIKDKQVAADTTRKAKIKIVVEDENGVKKEYNSVNDMPESVRNEFYKDNHDGNFRFNMDGNFKFADSARIKEYFNSPKWKGQVEAMKLQGEKMKKYYEGPEWKKQAELMKKQAEKMKEYYNSPEWKKQMEGMKVQGEKMKEYYNSPEWKKQMDEMKMQGEKMEQYYNSPEWKKQVDEMGKQGEEFSKKFTNSPEWKKMQEDMVRNAMEIAKHADEMAKQFGEYNHDDGDMKPRTTTVHKKTTTTKAKKAADKKAEAKEKAEKTEQPEKPETNN